VFAIVAKFSLTKDHHTVHRIVNMNRNHPGSAALIPPNGAPPQPMVQAKDPQDQLLEMLSNNLADAYNRAIHSTIARGPRVREDLAKEWMRQVKSLFDWVNAFQLLEI
jgi:hypothetical protein